MSPRPGPRRIPQTYDGTVNVRRRTSARRHAQLTNAASDPVIFKRPKWNEYEDDLRESLTLPKWAGDLILVAFLLLFCCGDTLLSLVEGKPESVVWSAGIWFGPGTGRGEREWKRRVGEWKRRVGQWKKRAGMGSIEEGGEGTMDGDATEGVAKED